MLIINKYHHSRIMYRCIYLLLIISAYLHIYIHILREYINIGAMMPCITRKKGEGVDDDK